jgi:hypothetical protein
MLASLSSLVPNADGVQALDVEEVAGALFAHLNSFGQSSGRSIVQEGLISDHYYSGWLAGGRPGTPRCARNCSRYQRKIRFVTEGAIDSTGPCCVCNVTALSNPTLSAIISQPGRSRHG